jgi:hypothetical protein
MLLLRVLQGIADSVAAIGSRCCISLVEGKGHLWICFDEEEPQRVADVDLDLRGSWLEELGDGGILSTNTGM